jgi:hypothetical protein
VSETKARIFSLTDDEFFILKTIGNGNATEGARIAVMWAAHFHNCGLTTELDLDCIGLRSVSPTDKWPDE